MTRCTPLPYRSAPPDLLNLCLQCLQTVLGTPVDVRHVDTPFQALGVDSRAGVALLAELSQRTGRPLGAALLFAHPTLEQLAAHLSVEAGHGEQETVATDARADTRLHAARERHALEPVAVIGIGCRFPGGATNPEAFWTLLTEGRDAVSAPPPERFASFPTRHGSRALERGGYLTDVSGFDAGFFGISPREAAELDPQQRLMLELSWEALEDAGVLPVALSGSRTGVFFGCMWRDYLHHSCAVPEAIEQHTATGVDTSIIAARVSYRFGLRGPSLTVNTACSSSLVAVHLACQSLRQGESTLALAGGVNLILAPHSTIAMERFGGLASDGRCKVFDAAADGYVRGEGGGVIVLKLLREALRDGDPIYCVIRASSVNNDGASNGLTAPSPLAQAELLRDAYARAGLDPRRVHYIEAHGTGTRLGDPIEVEALGQVLGRGRSDPSALRIGSVKSNLGHLEAAAGMAGLIKVALSVHRRWIPKNLHFCRENPELRLAARGLAVQREAGPWPASDEPPLAGVSAFGFGGTNAHVVIEGFGSSHAQLLLVAADDPHTLEHRREKLCAAGQAITSPEQLATLCQISASRWSRGAYRAARVVATPQDLTSTARPVSPTRPPSFGARTLGAPRVLFVFSGVGSQWLGMGRSLLTDEPAFRDAIAACDKAIGRLAGFSVIDTLVAGDERLLARCERYEPLIFSLQFALCALLESWGVAADAVLGHSIGEVAAAHCAGILTLDAAAAVICRQATLFSRLEGQGAMALVALSEGDAQRLIAQDAGELAAELVVAAVHGRTSTVVSGPYECVSALIERARAAGVFATPIRTEVPFHSPAIARLTGRLAELLSDVSPRAAHTPMLSTVRARWLRGPECDAAYWVENQRAPVHLSRALELLTRGDEPGPPPDDSSRRPTDGCARRPWIALEIAPHALLARELAEGLTVDGALPLVLPTMLRGVQGRGTLLATAAALYEAGLDLDVRALSRGCRRARLPEAAARHLPLTSSADSERNASLPLTLPLSAHTADALRELAESLCAHLHARGDLPLDELVYKAATRRAVFAHRLAVTGNSRLSLCEGLAAYVRGDHAPGLVAPGLLTPGRPKIADATQRVRAIRAGGPVFVFSGHGSHWPGMCTELLAEEPIFREAIERCEQALERHGFAALRAQLTQDRNPAPRADEVQPRLFAVQVALAALWRAWGIEPAAVIGHSVGEIAAAHVAGALDLDDAARAVCERARALAPAIGRGGMLLVELPRSQAQSVVAGYRGRLAVAVHHSPRFSVVSGDVDAIEQLVEELVTREVFCRRVAVDYASHGPQMAELAVRLELRLGGLSTRAPSLPMMSTSTGSWLEETACGPDYWARNLHEPVRFDEAIGSMLEAGFDSFLELSPHPLLTNAIHEIGLARTRRVSALSSLRRGTPERAALRESLSALFVLGHEIDWTRQFERACDRRVPLPTYPFQRTHHWKSVAGLACAEPITSVLRKPPPEPAVEDAPAQPNALARWRAASDEERPVLVRELLARELARVLRTEPTALDPDAPFSSLGVDSLLGLELRNRLEAELGIAVPATQLWSRPSLRELAAYLCEHYGGSTRGTEGGALAGLEGRSRA